MSDGKDELLSWAGLFRASGTNPYRPRACCPEENTTLKGEYADKVRADLADNSAEQERIRAELEALQAQLTALETDHALLASVNAALGGTAAGVPAPRRGRKPAATTGKKAPAGSKSTAKKTATKQTAPAKKAETKKTTVKKTPAVKKTGDKGPALTELIHAHLSPQSEPRTAREIAKVLSDAHPGRNINDNLVRTTTERLVARSRAERVKQGSTVYYTANADAATTAATQKATAAAS